MKKRLHKAILAAVVSAAVLCGCSAQTPKKPVSLDNITSSHTETASDTSQNEQSSVISSSDDVSSDSAEGSGSDAQISDESVPQSSGSSTTQSTSNSTPQSLSSSTTRSSSKPMPQSSSSSTTRSSSKPIPQSSSSSTTRSSSKPTPQSSSSSTTQSTSKPTPQSSSSSTTQSSSKSSVTQPTVTPSAGNSILNDYTSKWAYNHISAKQKQTYARLYESASGVTEECDISDLGITADDIYDAYWAFDYDNPQFLELGSGYSYSYTIVNGRNVMKSIKIEYGRSSSSVPQSDFDSVTQSVLAKARSQASDYERLKYVHDWIVNNTVYTNTDTDYESEADGPVIYGKAICEGYSKAFMYYAQSLGYKCVCAIGSAGGVDHMWNMVELNGQWYHVDVTWDDPVMSDGSQTLRDNYFLISDSAIRKDHSIAAPFTLPSAPNSYVQ